MEQAVLRDDMVASLEHDTKGWIETESVSLAMRTVPRHEFVPPAHQERAYTDCSFERFGSRVLAPSTVARLIEALALPADGSVLVVGAGVGYTAAVIAEIVGAHNVHAVDITRRLVTDARRNLAAADYDGVLVDCHNGSEGLVEYAPYDRILVEAAAVNPPVALVRQLTPEGRLLIPLGTNPQTLTLVASDGERTAEFGRVAFDPLLIDGEQGDTIERNRTLREDREFAARESTSRSGWEHDWIDWTQQTHDYL
ncbi:protein-L-isoaspartate O-methyltransferase family protein [Halocatena pleomorpha]|uniref:protein-L-isoaspartate(D-aspartate) O-methyltransferase n=1 Tax=Halocatena pleomorpha TaxID=1785090 RepID=A0A3P3R7Z6_9EURY|nr:protein-L-isoaspartate O-methyltransferase [Halocatena pleomorpha]RRJ29049.1 protein-L-isoaspartate O-methyltransferase [Halocatena pleomorpha]